MNRRRHQHVVESSALTDYWLLNALEKFAQDICMYAHCVHYATTQAQILAAGANGYYAFL